MSVTSTRLAGVISKNRADLLESWLAAQKNSGVSRPDLIKESELRENSRRFLDLFAKASTSAAGLNVHDPAYDDARTMLAELSRSLAKLGFTPSETASFIFSLKEPIFAILSKDLAADPSAIIQETWAANLAIDKLGLYTTEVFQRSRDEIISRQQQELLELSTPVVQLWDGVLALPLIGTLDSGRTQVVMESLLEAIVRTGAGIAIIDITGVPTVDTLVAQHLMKTVAAARLMGADCIISGIRAQIAQTIVHLGVDLQNVITKASLADALSLAMQRNGFTVVRAQKKAVGA